MGLCPLTYLSCFIMFVKVLLGLRCVTLCSGITIEVPIYKTIIPKDASIMVARTVES